MGHELGAKGSPEGIVIVIDINYPKCMVTRYEENHNNMFQYLIYEEVDAEGE